MGYRIRFVNFGKAWYLISLEENGLHNYDNSLRSSKIISADWIEYNWIV